jgi:hypothetical protein
VIVPRMSAVCCALILHGSRRTSNASIAAPAPIQVLIRMSLRPCLISFFCISHSMSFLPGRLEPASAKTVLCSSLLKGWSTAKEHSFHLSRFALRMSVCMAENHAHDSAASPDKVAERGHMAAFN